MRIDPSQLTDPLAHVLNAGAADATSGQRAQAAARTDVDGVDRLDEMLLRRLRANAASEAAGVVVSFQEAQVRVDELRAALAQDAEAAQAAQGTLDGARVRGLLDG